jgi:hypothetical protein
MTKSKVALLAITTLCSLSAFAEQTQTQAADDNRNGFYVRVDACRASFDTPPDGSDMLDTDVANCGKATEEAASNSGLAELVFCESPAANEVAPPHPKCVTEWVTLNRKVFVNFPQPEAFLKSIRILGGFGSSTTDEANAEDLSLGLSFQFSGPYEECVIDTATEISTNRGPFGYGLLKISLDQPRNNLHNAVLSCDNTKILFR